MGVSLKKIIELQNLKKIYPAKNAPILALSDVSFDVYEGEFVTVVGQSGCGKTTILKIIAGLLPKTDGTVLLDGQPVTGPRASSGIVFQQPVLFKWRSVLDNVLLPIEILRRNRRKYYQTALDLLDLTGLTEFKDRYPRELSGGMQQRVSICRALIHDPPVLLMDEPFGALDAMTRSEMNVELLRIWSERQKTSILITHSITEAVFLADRVIVMTPRPGMIADIVEIDLPRPRLAETRISPRFNELVQVIGRKIGLKFI
ncbi:MAG: ABC transporter ATP-binding protein [Candidatus Methylomirabilales bacterium]